MRADEILERLDDDQRDIASDLGGPVAVIAGAGTGKTRVLTHRIAYAVASGIADPYAILAVTFTTAAARELKERLEAMGVHGVQCRTFHSAALRQAQHFWPIVYGTALPRVIEERDPLIVSVCDRLGIPTESSTVASISAEISWTKQANVLPENYARLAQAAHRAIPHLELDTVAEAIVAYEEAKQESCVVDLDDLLLCDVALLSSERRVAATVHSTYRHLVVDEFQDVSPIQSRLIDLWLDERQDVCVVGDPAQTIHTFAGARSQYIEQFAAQHVGTHEYRLTRNYRSTPQILSAANALSTHGMRLSAVMPAGAEVIVEESLTLTEECEGIALWLTSLHRDGVAWSRMAVLSRTWAQTQSVRQILSAHSITCGALLESNPHAGGGGVRVGTLHAAKGREFDAVAISGVSEGSIPHVLSSTPQQVEEERRLLYVGLTRARQHLRLSWSCDAFGRVAQRSRFIDGIKAGRSL